MKTLDLNKTVYQLTKENPDIIPIMVGLGFKEITQPALRHSAGRLATIPMGCKIKGIDLNFVIKKFQELGWEVIQQDSKNNNNNIEKLKSLLHRLNNGEDIEKVKNEFKANFQNVDAKTIMDAEQQMLNEGIPLNQVQKLCDIHSTLFHGYTDTEIKQDDDIIKKLNKLINTPGHILNILSLENKAIISYIEKLNYDNIIQEEIEYLRQISIHYAQKGDLLYPLLNVKYKISGPSNVMWTVDNEIRDSLVQLSKNKEHNSEWIHQFNAVIQRAKEMIYKETNILFPLCVNYISDNEWVNLYNDLKAYKPCFGVEKTIWQEAENKITLSTEPNKENNLINLSGGSLSLEQLDCMLNTMPIEITFVDADNINSYFNEGEKLFMRPKMALGREVFSCHPPKVEPMVRNIINSFKSGEKDKVSVWTQKMGHEMYVLYMAVRNKNGEYLGTVELVQNMDFAKEHFSK